MELTTAVYLDLFVITVCLAALVRRGGLRHSHPAVLYVGFHVLVFTARAIAVAGGAPTFLSGLGRLEPVTVKEMGRALFYADVALIAATCGWARSAGSDQGPVSSDRWRPLRLSTVVAVTAATLPIGLYTFSKYALLPGVGTTAIATSSYSVLALTWPGLLLVALIYRLGFRLLLVIPVSTYLAVVAVQGYHRFRLVLPLVLLGQIYLDRRKRRWPGPLMIGLMVVLFLLFSPLKSIGRQVQAGATLDQVVSGAVPIVSDGARLRSGDAVILDQLALTIALADENGRVFLGRPYLNVLALPVPRTLWGGKPGLADHLAEISQPARPLAQLGAVTTLVGDLYLNFRLPGLFALAYLLARLSGRLYRRAYAAPYLSVPRFLYLLLACNLIQVFRDGLLSVPVFLVVQMLPLLIIAVLHWRGTTRMRTAFSGHRVNSPVHAIRAGVALKSG